MGNDSGSARVAMKEQDNQIELLLAKKSRTEDEQKKLAGLIEANIKEMQEAQRTKIKYLSFSGGGAKGAVYPGAFKALVEEGVMPDVHAVAGSSIGAITAALVATGITTADFDKFAKNQNFKALLGKGLIQRDGNPILETLRERIKTNISTFFQSSEWRDIAKKTNPETLAKLIALRDRARRADSKILFRDLALLNKVAPQTFKELAVTAVHKKSMRLKIFSCSETPDVEIALACRASASIPGVFKKCKINGEGYIDGAYSDAVPTKAFKKLDSARADSDQTAANTLLFVFSNTNNRSKDLVQLALYKSVAHEYKPSLFVLILSMLAQLLMGGKKTYASSKIELFKKIQTQYCLGTVAIDVSDISALDFTKAKEKSEQLYFQGYFATKGFLRNRGAEQSEEANLKFLMQEFFLDAYKELSRKGKLQKEEAEELLSFSKDKKYADKDANAIISEYLQDIAKLGTQDNKKHAISALVKRLNSAYTSIEIKHKFYTQIHSISPKLTHEVQIQNIAKLHEFDFNEVASYLSSISRG